MNRCSFGCWYSHASWQSCRLASTDASAQQTGPQKAALREIENEMYKNMVDGKVAKDCVSPYQVLNNVDVCVRELSRHNLESS